jgi:hypothetical protein
VPKTREASAPPPATANGSLNAPERDAHIVRDDCVVLAVKCRSRACWLHQSEAKTCDFANDSSRLVLFRSVAARKPG